jgi:hypothetical protein
VSEEPSFQSYYLNVERQAQAIIDREAIDYLLEVDYQEYLQHLIARIVWEPLTWDETTLSAEPLIARRKVRDYGGYAEVDQSRLKIRIETSNHSTLSDYLRYQPSTRHSGGEPAWIFEGSILAIEMDATERAVDDALKEIRFWLGGRNRDIEEGNASLPSRIGAVWKRKRDGLEARMGELKKIVETLKVPLHQSASAPKPVPFGSRTTKVVQRPSASARAKEPELVRKDVLGVVAFVESYSRQLEVTPIVFRKLPEEALRDLVLGMLNVNYPGSTGESFSKFGKTDMLLRVGGEGSLVVECKNWRGSKNYSDSLLQLFGYLTWRHSYGILLTFCKGRDMTAVIERAVASMRTHASLASGSVPHQAGSRFSSIHIHPQDTGKTIEVFHLFVDLFVTASTASD